MAVPRGTRFEVEREQVFPDGAAIAGPVSADGVGQVDQCDDAVQGAAHAPGNRDRGRQLARCGGWPWSSIRLRCRGSWPILIPARSIPRAASRDGQWCIGRSG